MVVSGRSTNGRRGLDGGGEYVFTMYIIQET